LSIYKCHPCCPYHGRNGQWCAWLCPIVVLFFLCVVVVVMCPLFLRSFIPSFARIGLFLSFLSLFSFSFILLSFDDTNPSYPCPSSLSSSATSTSYLAPHIISLWVLALSLSLFLFFFVSSVSDLFRNHSHTHTLARILSLARTLSRSHTLTPSDSLPHTRSHLPLIPRVSPSFPFLSFPFLSFFILVVGINRSHGL